MGAFELVELFTNLGVVVSISLDVALHVDAVYRHRGLVCLQLLGLAIPLYFSMRPQLYMVQAASSAGMHIGCLYLIEDLYGEAVTNRMVISVIMWSLIFLGFCRLQATSMLQLYRAEMELMTEKQVFLRR